MTRSRPGRCARVLQHRLDSWHGHRAAVTTGRLGYQVAADVTGLLRDPDDGQLGPVVGAAQPARGGAAGQCCSLTARPEPAGRARLELRPAAAAGRPLRREAGTA